MLLNRITVLLVGISFVLASCVCCVLPSYISQCSHCPQLKDALQSQTDTGATLLNHQNYELINIFSLESTKLQVFYYNRKGTY